VNVFSFSHNLPFADDLRVGHRVRGLSLQRGSIHSSNSHERLPPTSDSESGLLTLFDVHAAGPKLRTAQLPLTYYLQSSKPMARLRPYKEEATKRVLMASVFMLWLPGFLSSAELTQAEARKIYQPLEEQFAQYFKAKQPEKMASLLTDDGWRITDDDPVVGKEACSNILRPCSRW
jgi:hypothetical protein